MTLYIDENRRIYAYKAKGEETKDTELQGNSIFYDGDFDFFIGEHREGFEKVFYLEPDGTIRIEYEKLPQIPIEPTQLDRIEEAINQSNIALSQTYTEIENRIIDNYTMDLVENNII